MEFELIYRILKDECSPLEREQFFARLSNDSELMKEYARIKNKYVMDNIPYKPDVNRQRNKYFMNNGHNTNLLVKTAAILFIPLLMWTIYDSFINDNTSKLQSIASRESGVGVTYKVDMGVKASITLPDSTKIWLNSGSYLDVPNDFSKDNRKVFLSGEGYFNVKSDPTNPFLIETSNKITVKVTGTEFNLTCYENDSNLKLTLLRGSLELINEVAQKVISVNQNEEVVIDYNTKENQLSDVENDVVTATAWKDGHLIFKNTPMDEVIRRLERWFGKRIVVNDERVLDHYFTADFESESFMEILKYIQLTTNISYEYTKKQVVLSMP